MVFEGLNEKFQDIFSGIRKKGKLTDADIKAANREIKLALLEADVNFKVVKAFTKTISERASGEEVMKSLTPGQQYVKIVNDELTKLLGGEISKMEFAENGEPNIYMMVGLQGAGKTTTAGKLANLLRKEKKFKPLLVACDIYRPAAVKQLQVLGEQLDIPVFAIDGNINPRIIAKQGITYAKANGYDLVIFDTAGRLHVDDALMKELEDIKGIVSPTEILLTVDGMTGQESVRVADEFNKRLGITGVILTKLDGDTRGGAALSIAYTTGQPIKYIGTGEKLSDIEPFYPDRMANRILGMGDVLTLIDKAQNMMDEEKARELEKKLRNAEFDLNDFLDQIRQIQGMGSLGGLLEMIPGANKKALKNFDDDAADLQTRRTEAIICSMTPEERAKPAILDGSRKRRIAKGCGLQVADVNRLLKGYDQTRKMMKQMGAVGKKGKRGKFKIPFM
ncbi:MAG: signal recognition particle protein [Eubacteriaceae bacterium]|jgi:signal recognition particle subunit SRP54